MRKFIKKSVVAIMTVAMVISSFGVTGTKTQAAASGYVVQSKSVQALMEEYGVIAFDNANLAAHFHSNFMVNHLNMTSNSGLYPRYNVKEAFYFKDATNINASIAEDGTEDVLYTGAEVVVQNGVDKHIKVVSGELQKIDRPQTIITDADIEKDGDFSKYVDLSDVKSKFVTYNQNLADHDDYGNVEAFITGNDYMNNRHVIVGTGENYKKLSYTDMTPENNTSIKFVFSDFAQTNKDTLIVNIDLAGQTEAVFGELLVSDVASGDGFNNKEDNFNSTYNRVYFNFYDSSKDDKQYTGKISFAGRGFGTIIAPNASIVLPQNWDGMVVADDVHVKAQFHRVNGISSPVVSTERNPIYPDDNTPSGDTPSGDTPSGDTPSGDTPSGDTPSGDTPSGDTPSGDTPSGDTPSGDTPSGDTPSGDTPSGDTPSGDTPSGDTPSGDTPSGDTPSGDTPSGDTPSGDTPSGDTPSGDTPSGDTPSGDTPSGDTPSGDTPSGDTPSGDTPSGDTPSSDTPSSDTPSGDNKNDSKDKGSVSITIKDETTDDPVPGAKVEVTNPDGTKTEYVTDENGEITLEDVPEGDYKVVVKDVPKGYDVTIGTEVKVRVKKGDNKQNIVTNTGNKSMKAKNTQDAKNAKKALKGAADVKTGDDTVVSATLKQNSEIAQVGAKNNKTVTKTYNKQLKSFKKKHKKQSKEIAAWITIAGTKIDYPVMYSGLKNNTKYLKKNINGKKDSHGMLFASYITPTRKITYNNVIYGHNMKDGTMFTDLLKYQNKSFYKNHKYVKLSTKGYNYAYEVVEVIRISCKKGSKDRMILEKFADISNKKVFKQWKNQVTKNREYKCSGKYNRNDTLMILSTCEYEKENGRFILVCKQVKNKKVK